MLLSTQCLSIPLLQPLNSSPTPIKINLIDFSSPTTPTTAAKLKILHFTLRIPRTNVCLPIFESDLSSNNEMAFFPAQISKGCQLIMQEYISSNPLKTFTSMVKDLIQILSLDLCYEYFKKLQLYVSLFSD